jgi:hypothetical protein
MDVIPGVQGVIGPEDDGVVCEEGEETTHRARCSTMARMKKTTQ